MENNKSKINLANKICSILFFVFATISFILSVLIVVNISGSNDIYKIILNIPFSIISILLIDLNAFLIYAMIIIDKNNYKNPILYLLCLTLLFTIIIFIYCVITLNNKPVNSNNFSSQVWLILISTGISVLFSAWNCLINWGFLKPIMFKKEKIENNQLSTDNWLEQEQEN